MAIEDDENKDEKANKPLGELEENWKETCIGIWSRSASGEKVNEDGKNRICNGISVVRIGRNADLKKVKLSQTRGLQIIVQETGDESKSNEEMKKSHLSDRLRRDDEMPSLMHRVFGVMIKKTDTISKNVQHIRNEGVNSADVWDGIHSFCSRTYETTTRLISYVKPQDKINQMYKFASERAKSIANWWNDGGSGKN